MLLAYFLGLITLPLVIILFCALMVTASTDDELIRMSEMRG
jgi:hypothetical protein